MEGIENIGKNAPTELVIEDQAKHYLSETCKWAKFMAIIGFIGIGIMVLIGIFMSVFMGSVLNATEVPGAMGTALSAFMSVFYIAIALLYLYPVLKLYHFADQTKKALAENSSQTMALAFESQKSMFKFMGIMTIAIMGLYVVLIIAMVMLDLSAF